MLGVGISKARDEYYLKPRLIKNVRLGLSPKHINIAGLSEAMIYSGFKRIWKTEYEHYHRAEKLYGFTKFFDYLSRFYRFYPNIENGKYTIFLFNLTDQNLDPDSIECEMVKTLIKDGYEMDGLQSALGKSYDYLKKWFQRICGQNFTDLKYQHYWKYKIIVEIIKFQGIPFMSDIASRINVSLRSFKNTLVRIWRDAFNISLPNEIFKILVQKYKELPIIIDERIREFLCSASKIGTAPQFTLNDISSSSGKEFGTILYQVNHILIPMGLIEIINKSRPNIYKITDLGLKVISRVC